VTSGVILVTKPQFPSSPFRYIKSSRRRCLQFESKCRRTITGVTGVAMYPGHIAVNSGVQGWHRRIHTAVDGGNDTWNTKNVTCRACDCEASCIMERPAL